MNTKILTMLLLIMLLASPAFAAITVTWITPTSGATYNNNQANVGDVNLTFTVTDDNATVADHNLAVIVYNTSFVAFQTLVNDINVRTIDGTTDQNCSLVSVTSDFALYNCTIIWDMPTNNTMSDGVYYIDANISSIWRDNSNSDTNALRQITINTSLANSATIQALLLVIAIVVAAGLLIAAVLSIGVAGTDPAKTAVALVAAGIVAAVLLSILGVIALMI